MRRAAGLLLLTLATLLTGRPAAAAGGELPAEARAAFVRDRDVDALLAAFARAEVPATDGWHGLAFLAAERMPATAAREADGPAALAAAVFALRTLDLPGAQRALRRAGPEAGRAAVWLQALLHLRRGDDGGAVGALLAPPVFEPATDAFPLALLGAALEREDRRLLAAGARGALERAAARGRVPAVQAVARGGAVLHPESAPRTLALAVRVLRRMEEPDAAAALLRAVPPGRAAGTLLALEAALLAWQDGRLEDVRTWLAGTPPDGVASAWLALRRAGRHPRVHRPPGWRHEPGLRAFAAATARLATALGRATSPAEVASWARRAGRETWHAGSMRAFLEAQGFRVVTTAGDAAAADALLQARLPFVLLRLVPQGRGWHEVPAVVHAFDRRTGLWILDAPDARGLDVLPRGFGTKVRLLAAAPPGRQAALAALAATPAARRGARLEAALDLADRGDLEGALARLGDAATRTEPVMWLHAAALSLRRHEQDEAAGTLARAAEAAARSRRTPPALGMEAYLLGLRDLRDEALAAARTSLGTALRLDGPTITVLLAAFAVEMGAGDREAALALLERARRADPTEVAVLFHRGTLRSTAGDAVGARRDFRRALDRRPASVSVAVALAALDVREGRYEQALDVLRTTRRQDPALAEDPILERAERAAELEWIRNAERVADLRSMRRSDAPDTRRLLAYELARRIAEPDAAEAELREILDDPDEQVRTTALQVYLRPWLRQRIAEDAVLCRRIGQVLLEDAAAAVRAAAATVLGRVEVPHACRQLATVVSGAERDGDPRVRAAAARGLANHADATAQAALVAALEDPDATVRQAAIDSLFRQTAQDRGFRADADESARAAAVAAWRAWLAER